MEDRPIPRRSPYSPLTTLFREVHATHAEAEGRDAAVDEIAEARQTRAAAVMVSRRDFLRRAGSLGVGIALAGVTHTLPAAARSARRAGPRIVIVGAGLAGLGCADALHRAGRLATIYEAAEDHVGGRCWTNRRFFGHGRIGEHGGEFVSSEHTAMRALAHRFGLRLDDINGGELRGPHLDEVYWMDGAPYTHAEAIRDWAGAYQAVHAAGLAAPATQTWDNHTAAGLRYDRMSVPEFIDLAVPGGTSSRLGRLLLQNAISEYGADPSVQSALNLIGLMEGDPKTEIVPLAGTDERYHVRGGNDLLVAGLLSSLPGRTVKQGYELVAVRRASNGAYRCTFRVDRAHHDVVADHLVLALPFSTLRHVDLDRAGFSARKLRAIRRLGMGTSAKLVLELRHRTWGPSAPDSVARTYAGGSYAAPDDFQVVWDGAVGYGPGTLLVNFLGARQGATLGRSAHGPAPTADVDRLLDRIEPLFPGTRAAFTGRAWNDTWAKDRWHHGAYAYPGIDQVASFRGYEGVQEGRAHFAGEHTSIDFQGYMEGALRSGVGAAKEILRQL